MGPLAKLTIACALFFTASGAALAGELQFADDNCAITFLNTWHVMKNVPPQQGMLAAYSDLTGKRIVFFQRFDKKPVGPLDDRFIAGFEQEHEQKGGGERLSGKYIKVGGIKCYERLGTMVIRGKQVSTMIRLVPGEEHYYDLEAMRFDGDASQDPDIQDVIGSFRFLHPFVPTYAPDSDSIASRIGQLTVYLLVIIFVVGILIKAISSSLRPRPLSLPPRSTPPPLRPPPLPPGAQ
jgi:hypothetical protein